MKLTVTEIAELVDGEVIGGGDAVIEGVAGLDTAGPADLAFAKRERLKQARETQATAVLVPEQVEGMTAAQIVVENPYFAFGKVLQRVAEERRDHPKGIHPTAVLGKDVKVGKDVALGAYVVIGDHCTLADGVVVCPNTTIGAYCTLGEGTVIHSNTAIREYVRIGRRCTIHSCCSIGGDGFGFLAEGGRHIKIPQVGTVEIGDDVEIGCNCTVDRATMDKTVIGNGVKIDNHSHLAHNVKVGENSVLVAYARIGGSTEIGKNCILTEDVGVTNGVKLGDGCIVGASSKVGRSWPAGTLLFGTPAQPADAEKLQMVMLKKLPRLYETVRELKKAVFGKDGAKKPKDTSKG